MIRLAATAFISFLANAIALIVGAQLLPDMALDVSGFVIAVFIFTAAMVLVEPLTRQVALKNAPALLGSTALVATVLGLIATAVLSDGLRISGLTTWVLATIVVWLTALAGRLLLPVVMFKKILAQRSSSGGT
jgi:hypothetical protein